MHLQQKVPSLILTVFCPHPGAVCPTPQNLTAADGETIVGQLSYYANAARGLLTKQYDAEVSDAGWSFLSIK